MIHGIKFRHSHQGYGDKKKEEVSGREKHDIKIDEGEEYYRNNQPLKVHLLSQGRRRTSAPSADNPELRVRIHPLKNRARACRRNRTPNMQPARAKKC